jgi:FtsH-binding integral membrane protein
MAVADRAGLTAYDTQRIKSVYHEVLHDTTATSKATIMGALRHYLDFVNVFIMMQSFFERRHYHPPHKLVRSDLDLVILH